MSSVLHLVSQHLRRIKCLLIIQAQPTFITYFELDTRSDALALLSATNGVFQTGGVLGTLTLAFFSDKFGRKGGLAIVRYFPSFRSFGKTNMLDRVLFSS
jgi:hypothetical protein